MKDCFRFRYLVLLKYILFRFLQLGLDSRDITLRSYTLFRYESLFGRHVTKCQQRVTLSFIVLLFFVAAAEEEREEENDKWHPLHVKNQWMQRKKQ